MSQIEFIVEVGGGLSEILDDESMQLECGLDDEWACLTDLRLEPLQLSREEGIVNQEQTLIIWCSNADSPEMPLITRIDKE